MKKFLSAIFAIAFVFFLSVSVFTKHAEAAPAAPVMALAGAGMVRGGDRDRSFFNLLKDKYGSRGGVIAPSYVRAEALLTNGAQEYKFFLKLLGNESSTEHKLNEQDLFAVNKLGLFLMAQDVAVPGISNLETYPNPIKFPDEAGQLLTAHLEHIYNGFLNFKVGDTLHIPDYPTSDFRVVNTSQKSATIANSERDNTDGYVQLPVNLELKGRENNEITLKVPGDASHKVQSVAGAYKAKVVLILRGFKVTGAGQ